MTNAERLSSVKAMRLHEKIEALCRAIDDLNTAELALACIADGVTDEEDPDMALNDALSWTATHISPVHSIKNPAYAIQCVDYLLEHLDRRVTTNPADAE